jgi:hypothetical protein
MPLWIMAALRIPLDLVPSMYDRAPRFEAVLFKPSRDWNTLAEPKDSASSPRE